MSPWQETCYYGEGSEEKGAKEMAKKSTKKPAQRVKDLKAKKLSADSARRVRGGTDIFAKLGDIKGESIDPKHKDEIEILSHRKR